MELRALGRTGLQVSPVGLGTVKFGRNQQVKYPRGFDLPDDAHLRDLLAVARELGINLLDTAPAYGSAEERLGALLDHADDWVIVTKVGEAFEHGASRFDFSAAGTRASVERSLRRVTKARKSADRRASGWWGTITVLLACAVMGVVVAWMWPDLFERILSLFEISA